MPEGRGDGDKGALQGSHLRQDLFPVRLVQAAALVPNQHLAHLCDDFFQLLKSFVAKQVGGMLCKRAKVKKQLQGGAMLACASRESVTTGSVCTALHECNLFQPDCYAAGRTTLKGSRGPLAVTFGDDRDTFGDDPGNTESLPPVPAAPSDATTSPLATVKTGDVGSGVASAVAGRAFPMQTRAVGAAKAASCSSTPCVILSSITPPSCPLLAATRTTQP